MSPQMQWLGSLPQEKNYLAEAMEKGVGAYFGAKEKGAERKLELDKISYDKKVKAANMIVDVKKFMNEAQASQLDANPQVKELFEDLDWPYPEGSLMAAPAIKIEAIRAVGEGRPLEGMTMDETKKAAGVFIPEKAEKKITGTDIKAFEKSTPIPFYERLWPGAQSKAGKERLAFRERYKKQFGKTKGVTGDPLGVR